jgi:hypothetical protein
MWVIKVYESGRVSYAHQWCLRGFWTWGHGAREDAGLFEERALAVLAIRSFRDEWRECPWVRAVLCRIT